MRNKKLKPTLQKYPQLIKMGAWIDCYNKTIRDDDCSGTILLRYDARNEEYIMVETYNKALNQVPKDCKIRIRKLTPKECWRLMGQKDEDFEKAAQVNSNTQLYKQAGNSIVVNVLEEIFKPLFDETDTN